MTTTKITAETNTFPRDCEMGNGMIRMGYAHIERAHDEAIWTEEQRAAGVTVDSMARTPFQTRRYS